MIEPTATPQPYLKVYPPAHEVFAQPVERYARHLFPLLSIDLSVINADWSGWVHLLDTVEPEDEVVGKSTQPFHSYFLRENWVGFRLNDAGRYELLGDFRYFLLENPPGTLPEYYPGERDEMEKHYAQQHAAMQKSRASFAERGVLCSAQSLGKASWNQEPCRLFNQMGGTASHGYWIGDFPLDDSDEENVRPLMPDGTPFYFIASVTGWDYCDFSADEITLFFEPQSRTALLTFDWT